MKRVGGRVGFQRDAVVVQGAASVLVGEVLVDLAVGQQLAPLQGREMEAAEPFAEGRIGTAMRPSEAGQKAAAWRGGGCLGNGSSPWKAGVSCGEGAFPVKALMLRARDLQVRGAHR